MKIAVCVKYVPVVARLKFDYQNKSIIREGVPSEINPFDLLGLVRAVAMKTSPRDQVVVLSMGPPQAREGLVQCLALGADRAVLLTDRALAGSDTLATARALALALERENPDLIVCGRNSADAETGQVGPEIAELMGLPHIGQVRKMDFQPESSVIVAERSTDEGHQVIHCLLPAVVCVTEGIAPERFPSREETAAVQERPVEELTCADLSPDASIFGATGSPTWVADIRLVEPNRLAEVITDADPQAAALQLAGHLAERLRGLTDDRGGPEIATGALRYPHSRERSIWVVAETAGPELRQVSLEMLGKARELTASTHSEVAAVLVGSSDPKLTGVLTAYGADRVLTLDNSGLGPVYGRGVSQALAGAIAKARPYAVLFAATADGRDLASRIAARLKLGLTGDAIDLEINATGQLVQLKPALGGNVIAPILSRTLPNLVTLRPGVLTRAAADTSVECRVESIIPLTFTGVDVSVIETHRVADLGAIALTQARVVLGVGMGIGGPQYLPQLQALAQSIGATLATTRNVVHAGWLPHQVQVGISGRTIAPRVYIAVGIRGAFNHTVGIQKAGVILTINQNPRAPIFKAADYGIVGDWKEFLPPLVEALRPVLAAPS
jgi:electron transfer flavoprotein alpha subunit